MIPHTLVRLVPITKFYSRLLLSGFEFSDQHQTSYLVRLSDCGKLSVSYYVKLCHTMSLRRLCRIVARSLRSDNDYVALCQTSYLVIRRLSPVGHSLSPSVRHCHRSFVRSSDLALRRQICELKAKNLRNEQDIRRKMNEQQKVHENKVETLQSRIRSLSKEVASLTKRNKGAGGALASADSASNSPLV